MIVRKFSFVLSVFTFVFSTVVLAEGFTLSSGDVSGQLSMDHVFNGFGCSGKNISPELNWSSAPEGTKSFAVTVYDPDAPTGSGWWHWVVFDIPAKENGLARDAGNSLKSLAPKGSIQSSTSFGVAGFGGACPPEGDKPHAYIFTVYALKTDKLGLNADSNPELVGFYLHSNMLAKSSVIGYYAR